MEFKQFDLHGKVAIVTGGNGGIGLGIARGLAQSGADVAVAGRNADKTAKAVAELEGLGVRSVGLSVDVDAARPHDREGIADGEHRLRDPINTPEELVDAAVLTLFPSPPRTRLDPGERY